MTWLKPVLLLAVLGALSAIDVRTRQLPKSFYPLLLVIGLVAPAPGALIGAAATFLPLFLLYQLADFAGGGDVKAAGCCGFALGLWDNWLPLGLAAFILGEVLMFLLLPPWRLLRRQPAGASAPFVPYLTAGVGVILLLTKG